MKPVRIYLTDWCPFCSRARMLLDRKGLSYEAIDVDGAPETRKWLTEATGQRTIPQIFIGDESVGGYTELAALERSGALDMKLAG
ncbi:MAG: glutaredoxin [Myxococcota bacterium]